MIATVNIPTVLLLVTSAQAVERERALDISAEFATHVWTMTEASETASCDSSYQSDYTAGSWVGVPYDWGGFVTTDEFDSYLDEGYGAGSHSSDGVLWCTVGVDCSGFVSQAWETDSKYGTSTFYQVTTDISADALKRADALNKAGSHIVLFAYQSDAGLPIHYETYGTVVLVDSDQGWSSFSGYTPIRYDEIEDGPTTGTGGEPVEIDSFPLSDLRWTAGAASDAIDSYSCAPDTDESGPEMFYHFETSTGGTLHLTLSDDTGVDIDIHVLSGTSGDDCLARDDSELVIDLDPGEYWITADTYVSGYEFPGPYLLSGSFSGDLGTASTEPDPDTGESDTGWGDSGEPDSGTPETEESGPPNLNAQHNRPPRNSDDDKGGCACAQGSAAGVSPWAFLLAAAIVARRRNRLAL